MASSAKVPAVPSSEEATACTACRQHRHKKSRANGSNLVTSSIRWLLQQGTLAPKEPREATGQGPSRATQHRSDSLHQGKWQEASHNQDTQAPTLPAAAFDGSCRKAAARRPSKHTWHAAPRSPPQYMNRKSQCSRGGGPGHRHRRGISRDLTSVMAEATTTAALGGGSDSLWDVR